MVGSYAVGDVRALCLNSEKESFSRKGVLFAKRTV